MFQITISFKINFLFCLIIYSRGSNQNLFCCMCTFFFFLFLLPFWKDHQPCQNMNNAEMDGVCYAWGPVTILEQPQCQADDRWWACPYNFFTLRRQTIWKYPKTIGGHSKCILILDTKWWKYFYSYSYFNCVKQKAWQFLYDTSDLFIFAETLRRISQCMSYWRKCRGQNKSLHGYKMQLFTLKSRVGIDISLVLILIETYLIAAWGKYIFCCLALLPHFVYRSSLVCSYEPSFTTQNAVVRWHLLFSKWCSV